MGRKKKKKKKDLESGMIERNYKNYSKWDEKGCTAIPFVEERDIIVGLSWLSWFHLIAVWLDILETREVESRRRSPAVGKHSIRAE